jgi:hypothetical protein
MNGDIANRNGLLRYRTWELARRHGSKRIVPSWLARSNDTYREWFRNLAALRNQMVIFIEERFAQTILDICAEHGLERQTAVMVCDDLFAEHGPLAAPSRR